jgi:hypothetical protein
LAGGRQQGVPLSSSSELQPLLDLRPLAVALIMSP